VYSHNQFIIHSLNFEIVYYLELHATEKTLLMAKNAAVEHDIKIRTIHNN